MLTAEEIGRQLGKHARTVRKWTEAGKTPGSSPCPCERKMRGKMEVLLFDLNEVVEWCTNVGLSLEAFKTDGIVDRMFGLGGEPNRQGGSSPGGKLEPAADPLAGVQVGEERGAIRETLRSIKAMADDMQRRLRFEGVGALSSNALAQVATALAKVSQETRQLDEQELEIRTRRGELCEKAPERRAWGGLAGDFVAVLTRLEVDVGSSVKMELAAKGCLTPEAAGEGETVERIVQSVVRRACDGERARLASALGEVANQNREAA